MEVLVFDLKFNFLRFKVVLHQLILEISYTAVAVLQTYHYLLAVKCKEYCK